MGHSCAGCLQRLSKPELNHPEVSPCANPARAWACLHALNKALNPRAWLDLVSPCGIYACMYACMYACVYVMNV